MDCESLTPTQGATQQSVDCESQLKGPRNKAWIVSPSPQLKGPRNKRGSKKKRKEVGGKMCSLTKGNKIRSGSLTLAFPGAQKRAELRHPCILGDPQTKGDKIRSGSHTPAFSGAHKWVEMLRHPCILRDPQNKGGQNQKWVPHPCLLGSPKKGGNATSPLHSGGSLAKGTKTKVAELGARTKLWMCSPKEYHQKKFR